MHTGKPAGDDLREGKRTVLVAYTLDAASPPEQDILQSALGNPSLTSAQVGDVRTLMEGSGAVARVEADITNLAAAAHQALGTVRAAVDPTAFQVLNDLVAVTTDRVT